MDADAIADLFADFGAVSIKRMFGGAGLYREGVMFALLADGELYLKADAAFAADLAARGCAPFTYAAKTGRRTVASFVRVPEAAFDEPHEMAELARRALAAAHAADGAKRSHAATKLPSAKAAKPRKARPPAKA